jgi:hypothetical protein
MTGERRLASGDRFPQVGHPTQLYVNFVDLHIDVDSVAALKSAGRADGCVMTVKLSTAG